MIQIKRYFSSNDRLSSEINIDSISVNFHYLHFFFLKLDSIEIRMFHLKKKKRRKEAAVHHEYYSINQTLPLDGNNFVRSILQDKGGEEENASKNEDSLKNKIDQKSRRRQLPSSNKQRRKKRREKG